MTAYLHFTAVPLTAYLHFTAVPMTAYLHFLPAILFSLHKLFHYGGWLRR